MINGSIDYGIKCFGKQLCFSSHQDCLGSSHSSPRCVSQDRELLSPGNYLAGQFPHVSDVSGCILFISVELSGSSCLQCFFSIVIFISFFPRKGKTSRAFSNAFKRYCLSFRSRRSLKGETKIPVHIYEIFATFCAFWASIQD